MFFIRIVSGKFNKVIDDNLPDDKILSLKESINNWYRIPISKIVLKYNGKILDNDRVIFDYLIKNNDTIDLDLELNEINISKVGTYQLKWYVENGTTIKDLQNRVTGIIPGVIIGHLFGPNHDILKDGDIIQMS